jgi:hypothetical protein
MATSKLFALAFAIRSMIDCYGPCDFGQIWFELSVQHGATKAEVKQSISYLLQGGIITTDSESYGYASDF